MLLLQETTNSSCGTQEEMVEKLKSEVNRGNWSKVLEMYKQESELRTVGVTNTGDTVLHVAISKLKVFVVMELLDFLVGEEEAANSEAQNNEVVVPVDGDSDKSSNLKAILGAKNKKGDTPLHLAASLPWLSDSICKKIAEREPSLIATRNNAGETPLFMAVFHGNTEAFFCLHHLYTEKHGSSTGDAYYKNDDNDTILHSAIAKGHIGLAIEIVYLYKGDDLKEMMKPNKNGLSPLHLLAATPSAFKSTDLPRRSFLFRLLYHWFFRVEKKKQATRRDELKQLEGESLFEILTEAYFDCFIWLFDVHLYVKGWPRVLKIGVLLCWYPLTVLAFILLLPLPVLGLLFILAGNWFNGIRKMKEKHTWSIQIMEQLIQHASDENMSANAYEQESEAGYIIVDTPLVIAANNDVIEMVEKILERFPSIMDVVNEEGKNIVLLAAEKRQTKLYEILCRNEQNNKSAFRKVDKDGNTALHLAAKLGAYLNWQTTTMVEEFKWYELVQSSVPSELWEMRNKDGKRAEEIFRESSEKQMTRDTQWVNQTSQACSVVSSLVATMAFTTMSANFDKKHYSSLVVLSLSLTSTISFLSILAFRSQSLLFWRYVPFRLHLAILTMFGSIVSLWISLMLHYHSVKAYAIIGLPIALVTIFSLPTFIGPTLMYMFTHIPVPDRKAMSATRFRRTKTLNPRKCMSYCFKQHNPSSLSFKKLWYSK